MAKRKPKPEPAKPLSHPEKFQRRREIADDIRKGDTVADVCQRYEVTVQTVRNACAENGVAMPAHDAVPPVRSTKRKAVK